MTIIVYRNGVMVADTNCWESEARVIMNRRQKIVRLSNGALFGAAGASEDIFATIDWMEAGATEDARPKLRNDIEGILVKPGAQGAPAEISYLFQTMIPVPCSFAFAVVGCAKIFMLGALHHGASAYDAAKLAQDWTDAGGGPLQVEAL